jgi:anaerobic magnesium-protoporphyrin IX monomethyl ester cyclase
MKILLIQSHLGGHESPVFPLGLYYLARLVGDHQVEIFDPNVSEHPDADLRSWLTGFRPDIVGISLRNIDSTNKRRVVFYYRYFRDTLYTVRKVLGSRCKVVGGGPGFSMFAEEIMRREPMVDYGVFLEGEKTFPELLQNLATPEKVQGVYFRQGDKVCFSGPRNPVSPEEVPLPDRSERVMRPYVRAEDAIGVETKRGCPLTCAYCVYGFLNGKRYRLFSPARVVDDIEACVRRGGARELMFIDPVFNIPSSHAQDVCREIIRRGVRVSWSAWFHDSALTRPLIRLARRAGCRKMMLSPDGFDDKALERLGKTQKKRDIVAGFEILRQETGDMEVCYNFFRNPPGQTWKGVVGLMHFYLRAKSILKNRVHFEFNTLRIEPHTRLYDMALREGAIRETDDLLYPTYYTNPHTRLAEKAFDLLVTVKERRPKISEMPFWKRTPQKGRR